PKDLRQQCSSLWPLNLLVLVVRVNENIGIKKQVFHPAHKDPRVSSDGRRVGSPVEAIVPTELLPRLPTRAADLLWFSRRRSLQKYWGLIPAVAPHRAQWRAHRSGLASES